MMKFLIKRKKIINNKIMEEQLQILNTNQSHIINLFEEDECDDLHLVYASLLLKNNFTTNNILFSYILYVLLTDDNKYDEYMRIKKHEPNHYNIIVNAKRLQKCLHIILKLCKGEKNISKQIIENVCFYNGNSDKDSLINDAFIAINECLIELNKYKFHILLHDSKVHTIYAFIIDELLDCGDLLENHIDQLAQFLVDSGLDNYKESLKHYDIIGDSWIHEQFRLLN